MSCLKVLLLSFVLILNGCAGLKDFPVCYELSIKKGFCTHVLSDRSFYVDDVLKFEGKTWWELRRTNIQVPKSSWEIIKSHTIKSCKRSGKCDSSVTNWERSSGIIDKKIQESNTDSNKITSGTDQQTKKVQLDAR